MSRGSKVAIALLLLAALGGAAFFLDVKTWVRTSLAWVDSLGPWAPPFFIAIYIVSTVCFIPAWALTLGAGALFGIIMGTIYVSIGSTLGATAAFFLGRTLARDLISKKLKGSPKLSALDEALAREGWKIVGLMRLSPVLPFTLLNYAFGLTRVRANHYILASWIGMMPGTLMYVYLGSLAKNLAEVGAGARQRTTAEWVLYAVGLIATILATVYLTRMANRALQKTPAVEGHQ